MFSVTRNRRAGIHFDYFGKLINCSNKTCLILTQASVLGLPRAEASLGLDDGRDGLVGYDRDVAIQSGLTVDSYQPSSA